MLSEKRIQELRTMPYEEYLQTPEWQEKRQQALDYADHRCQLCYSSDDLNVHHRTYERRGSEALTDLTVLCKVCHEKHHSRMFKHEQIEHTFSSICNIALDNKHNEHSSAIPTGYQDLDHLLKGGLHKSDLILLGGRTRNGKTAFAVNIGYNAAQMGNSVAIFSLEMNKRQIYGRLESIEEGRVHFNNWNLGGEGTFQSVSEFQNLPIWISDTVGTVDNMRQELIQLIAEIGGVDLVIIDYIGLIEPYKHTKNANAEQQIRAISRGLKLLAREFDIPVLALAQLSRAVENRFDKRPELIDLRDSGAQEQDSDIVLLIHCRDVYDTETIYQGVTDIIAAKHRNGPTGEASVFFAKEYSLFLDFEITPSSEKDEEDNVGIARAV